MSRRQNPNGRGEAVASAKGPFTLNTTTEPAKVLEDSVSPNPPDRVEASEVSVRFLCRGGRPDLEEWMRTREVAS